MDFRDADIRDVVLFLTETCRRQDPPGINILPLGMDDVMTVLHLHSGSELI